MTTRSDLLAAITALLGAGAPAYSAAQANDAFEAYALSLILEAAVQEGATIEFESATGVVNPAALLFRASPGNIFSVAHDYTHANIYFPDGHVYEANVGVYVEGLAGVIHECDVMVMDKDEALFCRRNGTHPKKRSLAMSAECKFYSSALGIRLGREFIGITVDLGSDGRFFLSNSDGASVDRFLAHHGKRRALNLTPIDADSQAQTISQFRRLFHDQISKRRG